MIYPTAKEAKVLRRERKTPNPTPRPPCSIWPPAKNSNLKIRAIRLFPENPAWLVLLKNAPEGQAREKEKWSGSDLILRELATAKEFVFGNVAEFAFDKKGLWLAMIIDAYGMGGNGVAVRNMATGVVSSLDNDKANYKSLAWTEKGEALACLKGKEEKGFEGQILWRRRFHRLRSRSSPEGRGSSSRRHSESRLRSEGRQVFSAGHDHQPQSAAPMDRRPGRDSFRDL